MSSSSTTKPAFHPSMRVTFDAPGFPEPSCVTSLPARRATMVALGERAEEVGEGHEDEDGGHASAILVPQMREASGLG